ncbi:MAG: DNA polymerase-3 subunit delta' [Cellvibrionaceae bacterium]|jgi:DNA polymerase-3 subunit delta'
MWQIKGHDWAVDRLRSAIIHQRVGHAWLFTGPSQVGRTRLATIFAQALNCESEYPESRPCGICRKCKLIASGRHPDLLLIKPTIGNRGNAAIKIDQIRELQQSLNRTAMEGPFKIAIISDFNTANIQAANAFLKTLEEPPSNVVLILTASESDALLPTINSRCRTINLRPVPLAVIKDHLIKDLSIPTDTATTLAHLANGRIGWAIQAAGDKVTLASHLEKTEQLNAILKMNRVERFKLSEKLSSKPEDLHDLFGTWLSWWRDALILANGQDDLSQIINVHDIDNLQQTAERTPADKILSNLTQTDKSVTWLDQNANVRLLVENLLLSF